MSDRIGKCSGEGWAKNVHSEVAKIPDLAPSAHGGSGCGV